MKKFSLSIFIALFLCGFVSVTSVSAVPVYYNMTGSLEWIGGGSDTIGWDGSTFDFSLKFDSSDVPVDIIDNAFISQSHYISSESHLVVGATEYLGGTREVYLKRDYGGLADIAYVQAINLNVGGQTLLFGGNAGYPIGTFGTPPFPIDQNLSVDAANIFLGGVNNSQGQVLYVMNDQAITAGPVPEPTTMLLFGAGLVGLAGFGRKKFKK